MRSSEALEASRSRDPLKAIAFALALAMHGGVVAAVAYGHSRPAEPVVMPRDFMVAKIVRLGKKREPKLLPTIPTQPVAEAPKEAVKLTQNEAAPPAPPKPEKPPVPKTDTNTLKNALARARNIARIEAQAEQEGDPEGDPSGTSDTAAAGDLYATQIYKVYHEQWNIPQLAAAQGLRSLARIFIDDQGNVLKASLTQTSGSGPFDSSVVEILSKVKKLPPPPAHLARRFERSGIALEFSP